MGDQKNCFGQIAHQAGGRVQAGGEIHDEVAEVACHVVEQTGVLGAAGIVGDRSTRACQQFQSPGVLHHEALHQETAMRCRFRTASPIVNGGRRFRWSAACPSGAMSTSATLLYADCNARARLTATVVAPLPPVAVTTEK